jgi:putative membrane protein
MMTTQVNDPINEPTADAVPIVPERTAKDYAGLAARGFVMGSAEVVPGVSGGTMAFILGIYEELITSIKNLANPDVFKAALSFDLKRVLQLVNWQFLVAVAVGMFLAIFTLAQGLEWLLVNEPIYLFSFFFGLVLASAIVVARRVERWHWSRVVTMLVGGVFAYFVVGLVPAETPEAWWFFVMSGAIAICAMILPGISGSFILLLLGKYEAVLAAVNDRDFLTLIYVSIGAAFGLVTFAQVLSWLFKKYHDLTVAFLTGLMFGSLRKIWPWKETLEAAMIDGEEVILREANVLPAVGPEVAFAAGLAALALVLVIILERVTEPEDVRTVTVG